MQSFGRYDQKGFPFPLPILLVRVNLYETDFEECLEGTLVEPVEAFYTDSIIGRRYETVLIAWNDYAKNSDHSPALIEDTRRRLVDWINLDVMSRVRNGRRPIWI